jgi:hypothetical protein
MHDGGGKRREEASHGPPRVGGKLLYQVCAEITSDSPLDFSGAISGRPPENWHDQCASVRDNVPSHLSPSVTTNNLLDDVTLF